MTDERVPGLIVFSDLDGTLLDHETYEWEPAKPALDRMREREDLLVLASSKTAEEIVTLRGQLGFEHCPAIVENGSGVLAGSKNSIAELGSRDRILAILERLPGSLRGKFTGFSDYTIEALAEVTGLSPDQAQQAANRDFTEPGLFSGTDEELRAFLEALRAEGVFARKGGRFLTLCEGQNKSNCMDKITSELGSKPGYLTVALGDAPNDIEMLSHAERGFLIPNPGHVDPENLLSKLPATVTLADAPGPLGWNTSVLSVIEDLEG